MIKLQNVGLKYNDKWLFRNFNLDLPINKSIALKGMSGGGKSSIINLILGFFEPDEGEIYILGNKLTQFNCSEIRSNISYLPQNYNILNSGTVFQTIMNPFKFEINKNIKIDREIILNEFKKLNLDSSIIDNPFNSASGGEKQRIALIISKLLNRKIILLDEPTSALDKESKYLAAKYILELENNCVITISHDEEWISFCNNSMDLKIA